MKIAVIHASTFNAPGVLTDAMTAVIDTLPVKPTLVIRKDDRIAYDFTWTAKLSCAVCRNLTAPEFAAKARNLFAFGDDPELRKIVDAARKQGVRVKVFVTTEAQTKRKRNVG